MKKFTFVLAIIMVVIGYIIVNVPNVNHIETLDAAKAIFGLIVGVLSVVFMLLSIFSKRNAKVTNSVKYALLIGIIAAVIFVAVYIYIVIINR